MSSNNNKTDYASIPPGDTDAADDNNNNNASGPPPSTTLHPTKSALLAEVFGTAILVQIGTGAYCVAIYLGQLTGAWQAAAIWTLGATMGIYASAAQSGGHLNPAVSLSFALVRPSDFPIQKILPYWIAQLIGAMLGAVVNLTLFTTVIYNFEQDLTDKHRLVSATAFGNYWR
jgi:glycerol uptake facilitator protein